MPKLIYYFQTVESPSALNDKKLVDLVSSGVSGIHLYTMNNPYVAKKITEGVKSILNSINDRKVDA